MDVTDRDEGELQPAAKGVTLEILTYIFEAR
jgi:hypothetical protein